MRITLPVALGTLFVGLKLTGYILWSWWLVLLPFYILPLIVFGGALLGILATFIGAFVYFFTVEVVEYIRKKRK